MGESPGIVAYPRLKVLFRALLILLFVGGAALFVASFHAGAPGGGNAGRIMRDAGVELMALSVGASQLASALKARWSDR